MFHFANTIYIVSTVSSAGVQFTTSQFVGLIIGFIFLLVFVSVMAVLVTRRCFVGRFGGAHGVIKFKGEEVRILEHFTKLLGLFNAP